MKFLPKVILSLFISCNAISVFAAEKLSCETMPGKQLCSDMRILRSYLVSCSGSCGTLFSTQAAYFRRIANTYYENFNKLPDADLTSEAILTGQAIKAYGWRGKSEALNLAVTEGQRTCAALNKIVEISDQHRSDPVDNEGFWFASGFPLGALNCSIRVTH